MRLSISKSKNSISYYIKKDVTLNGKRTSKIIEKLGTHKYLLEKLNGNDPETWAREYVAKLNDQEKENSRTVITKRSPVKLIEKDKQNSFNCGYLFLQKIYHELGLHKITKEISQKYKFEYDLDSILSRLVYSRILYPSSKLNTFKLSKEFAEQPNFDLHHIYRSLDVIANEMDFIQSQMYKNSLKVQKRNKKILYYDCTNYFFEIENPQGLKQYGYSNDHKPNPIVQMGLFMDGSGIPLAFSINQGNTNEQVTLNPLEKQIIKDFDMSKFVVCTDAGLSSTANRKFNSISGRAFITTQSVKKLKKHHKEWALDPTGWKLINSNENFDLTGLDSEVNKEKIFYKERWINEDGIEQRLIVSFSFKYQAYKSSLRQKQIEIAIDTVDKKPSKLTKKRPNDYKRFKVENNVTQDGEVADNALYDIDVDLINKEAIYDGFYAVCTNLEDDASLIINVNKNRWKIEESFRLMKSEFKSRPVYVRNDDRIKAHFTTCFISLMIYRLLEARIEKEYTSCEILDCLRNMNLKKISHEGYEPSYTRTNLTDLLHDKFGFRTDYEIVSTKTMNKIQKDTKK